MPDAKTVPSGLSANCTLAQILRPSTLMRRAEQHTSDPAGSGCADTREGSVTSCEPQQRAPDAQHAKGRKSCRLHLG